MTNLSEDELLDWLVEAYSSDSCDDAIGKEHSTTAQTPEFWANKAGIREQAYKQIVALIKKPKVTEEWIEEKAKELLGNLEAYPVRIIGERVKDFIRSLVEEIK